MEIEVVIPDSAKDWTDRGLTAGSACKFHDHAVALGFRSKIKSDPLPVISSCRQRLRSCQHAIVFGIEDRHYRRAATDQVLRARIAFKTILGIRFDDYNLRHVNFIKLIWRLEDYPQTAVAAVCPGVDNNLRLVVKGGGHSYQGTSNAPDSLLIWTRSPTVLTSAARLRNVGGMQSIGEPAAAAR